MPPKHLAHLSDIVESTRLIYLYVDGLSYDQYVADIKARDAVERRFAVIDEALNRLRRDAPEVHATIDHTAEIAAFRNIIIHVYDQLDHAIVWKVIETDLLLLQRQAEAALGGHQAADAASPVKINQLLDYLKLEAPGGDELTPNDLTYLGLIKEPHGPCWVWEFTDSYGTISYVTAEPYEDSYLLGYGDKPPAGLAE